MASILGVTILLLLSVLHLSGTTNANRDGVLLFDTIYQFGDSLSDTGNFARLKNLKIPNVTSCAVFPYGEAFFGYPTGRCSDGLLMTDFFAKAFGLPLLNPYMDASADFTHGVVFSVAGATALDAQALEAKNLTAYVADENSLPVQIRWFNTHLQSISSTQQGRHAKLTTSLFFMGEIGGNDINLSFLQGKSFEFVYNLIPDVVQGIKTAIQEVIKAGATYIVVPGNFPIGCIPKYQVRFASNDISSYDDLKCLKSYNRVAQIQNDQIQEAILEIQEQNPNAVITYADYYNAYIWLLQNATSSGFEEDQVFNPCCGTSSNACGSKGAPICANPETRISWDGIHPTHQANKYMSHWIMLHILNQMRDKLDHQILSHFASNIDSDSISIW